MLEDGEEVSLGWRPLSGVAQHAVDLVRLGELHPHVLEAMDHFLVVVDEMVLKDVQVSGEVMELNFSQVLEGRREVQGKREERGRRKERERRGGRGKRGEKINGREMKE